MDWKQVIKRNREALAVVVAGLVALLGKWAVDPRVKPEDDVLGGAPAFLPRRLRLAILRILRPAESALRRLIVIVAAVRTTNEKQATARDANAYLPDFSTFGQSTARPAFRLIDPRKRFGEFKPRVATNLGIPRISVPGFSEPASIAPAGNDAVNAEAILRRIAALDDALKTLPRQARRLNRLMARRAKAAPGPGRIGPIRPGHPPGFRKRAIEPVDDILRDCHFLARTSGFKPP